MEEAREITTSFEEAFLLSPHYPLTSPTRSLSTILLLNPDTTLSITIMVLDIACPLVKLHVVFFSDISSDLAMGSLTLCAPEYLNIVSTEFISTCPNICKIVFNVEVLRKTFSQKGFIIHLESKYTVSRK